MRRAAASLLLLLFALSYAHTATTPKQLERQRLKVMAEHAAAQHKVPPGLLKAVCTVESAWKRNAIGDDGKSFGLCQVQIPTALDLYGPKWKAELSAPERREAMRQLLMQPEMNVKISARLLQQYLKQFHGDETLVILAYNGGPANKLIDYLQKVRRTRIQYETPPV